MAETVSLTAHAPLLKRLRGHAFIPGVHYTAQADVWMNEAADHIEADYDLMGRMAEILFACPVGDIPGCTTAMLQGLLEQFQTRKLRLFQDG